MTSALTRTPSRVAPHAAEVARVGRFVLLVMVSGAMALGFSLVVPRTNALLSPGVDPAASARSAAPTLSFAPLVPSGLGEGWVPLTAETRVTAGRVVTWHLGYATPLGSYAGIEQAPSGVGVRWADDITISARPSGTVQIAGRSFVVRNRPDRFVTSYVWTGPSTTVIVTGKATAAELAQLVEALHLPAR